MDRRSRLVQRWACRDILLAPWDPYGVVSCVVDVGDSRLEVDTSFEVALRGTFLRRGDHTDVAVDIRLAFRILRGKDAVLHVVEDPGMDRPELDAVVEPYNLGGTVDDCPRVELVGAEDDCEAALVWGLWLLADDILENVIHIHVWKRLLGLHYNCSPFLPRSGYGSRLLQLQLVPLCGLHRYRCYLCYTAEDNHGQRVACRDDDGPAVRCNVREKLPCFEDGLAVPLL